MKSFTFFLFSLIGLCIFICFIKADETTHRYENGEAVIVWADSVRPIFNNQESYPFFNLPYCRGMAPLIYKHETLAQALIGEHLVSFGAPIRFLLNTSFSPLCEASNLSFYQVNQFSKAIQQQYRLNFYLDDLPLWADIGTVNAGFHSYIFTHFDFLIEYNQNQIISASLNLSHPFLLPTFNQTNNEDRSQVSIPFTMSTTFISTTSLFKNRFKKFLDSNFFEQKIHWLSVANSIFLVFILVGIVFYILSRALRKDFARYESEELFDLDRDLDDYGWKLVHSDVFRPPPHLSLFSALLGSGIQFAVLSTLTIILAMLDAAYTETGDILSIVIILYVLSSFLNGYISCRHSAQYSHNGGQKPRLSRPRSWLSQALLSASLIPSFVCVCFFILNWIATEYMSSKVVPLFSMLSLAALFLFIIVPWTIVGGIFGEKSFRSGFPCRVSFIPRPIPETKWMYRPKFFMFIAGLLPFCSLFVELNYLISSFFGYKIYYAYGFTFMAFISVLLTCAGCSIVSTYILLNAEDHRWHWVSFGASASTAFYIFLYSCYFYFFRSNMYGLFQFAFYFGHVLIGCFCTFILLGSIGYYSSSLFVRRIYSSIKID